MKVGSGIFTWDAEERRSNRYGAFALVDADYEEKDNAEVIFNEDALRHLVGKKVKIYCKVIETRKSGHVGDLFLKITPSTPKLYKKIKLGVGILDLEELSWPAIKVAPFKKAIAIAIKPTDGRTELWLDPRKLYKLHDQTVEVYIEPTNEPCHAAPAR